MAVMHPSHEVRFSDSSVYDYRCVNCHATDERGATGLYQPCPTPESERITAAEWYRQQEERHRQAMERLAQAKP